MAFDPTRLTQARHLAGLTKTALAQQIGISAAGVGQWAASTTPPRPDHLQCAAEVLDVPIDFFALGRPYAQVEQTWELAYALEKRVSFPPVDLPGVSAEARNGYRPGMRPPTTKGASPEERRPCRR
jgi:transcriptional regulator with XRE-family HTH domain